MKIQQFTHGDLDGAGCALVGYHTFTEDELVVTHCQYGSGSDSIDAQVTKFLEKSGSADALLITDICPSERVCERIEALKDSFEWVLVQDHHGTTAWASKYKWVEHEAQNKRCGARMLLDWSKQSDGRMDNFVSAVDAYDRWQLDSVFRKRGEVLNTLYKFLGFDGFIKEFRNDIEADETGWISNLVPVLEARLKEVIRTVIQNQMKDAIHVDRNKNRYAFLSLLSPHASEIGHAILDKFPNVDYVAMALPGTDTISLRARTGGVDVAEIAKAQGGGGHAAAAGFPYPLGKILWNAAAGVFE